MHDDQKLTMLPTRAAFIRGLPEGMPIEEVIERGREVGLSINPSDVHSARYYMRQEAARKAPPQAQNKTSVNGAADLAATVRRNYALLDSQRSDDAPAVNGNAGTNGTATNGAATNGKKAAGRGASAPIVTPSGRGKTGSKSRPFLTAAEIVKFEDQVRYIGSRIGTDRVRDIMDELENTVRDLD